MPIVPEIPLLAAEIPALFHSIAIEVGVIASTVAGDLVQKAERFSQEPGNTYSGADIALECRGLLAGIHPPRSDTGLFWQSWSGLERSAQVPPPGADPIQLGALHFLEGLRNGSVGTLGVLNGSAEEYAGAFLSGAVHVFPETQNGKPAFLRAAARGWGRLAGQCDAPEDTPLFPRSEEIGEICAGILQDYYRLGIAGGLSASRLNASLHARDIVALLRAKGWLIGIIESLRRTYDDQATEPARILESNLASIITRAFNGGNFAYIRDAARAVIDPSALLASLDAAIAAVSETDPSTAALLRSRRTMIISKLLHAGQLKITREPLLGLKGWKEN